MTGVVKAALVDVKGRASAEHAHREAHEALASAQAALDGAIRMLDGLGDEQAARQRLSALREARDAARQRVEQLGPAPDSLTVSVNDWDRLTLDERRALVRAVVERVTVAPGRGTDRIAVELVGQ